MVPVNLAGVGVGEGIWQHWWRVVDADGGSGDRTIARQKPTTNNSVTRCFNKIKFGKKIKHYDATCFWFSINC